MLLHFDVVILYVASIQVAIESDILDDDVDIDACVSPIVSTFDGVNNDIKLNLLHGLNVDVNKRVTIIVCNTANVVTKLLLNLSH